MIAGNVVYRFGHVNVIEVPQTDGVPTYATLYPTVYGTIGRQEFESRDEAEALARNIGARWSAAAALVRAQGAT